jgi:hypothetical protein
MSANTLDVAINKALWRLLPITMLLFFISLLDRTNISFAALEMNKDLGLSPPQYGTAAGIFFVGYFGSCNARRRSASPAECPAVQS